jgi:hypothetical protein
MFIDGQSLDSAAGATTPSVTPATGEWRGGLLQLIRDGVGGDPRRPGAPG